MSREILVYADWQGMDAPHKVGVLRTDVVRGGELCFILRYPIPTIILEITVLFIPSKAGFYRLHMTLIRWPMVRGI